ncbi:hypothetical protein LOTGIDRAFT_84942, partial [Lottia gigantea]
CGSPAIEPVGDEDARVVGGRAAHLGAWPWTVMLLEVNMPVCGGAILNERVIITAAHCFEDQDPTRWTVTAGGIKQNTFEYSKRMYQIESIMMYKDYDEFSVENDIALVMLKSEIKFSNYIRPICLPSENDTLEVGTPCYLAGYGDTHGDSDRLNQVKLPIIAEDKCSQVDWYGNFFKPNSSFCAGYAQGGKDACTGDSGSPLVCRRNSEWQVHGISSWGYGCAEPKWPGIYTRVNKYLPWINHHL